MSAAISNILLRLFSFCVLVLLARFAYVVTVKGKFCESSDFCFFPQTTISEADAAHLRRSHYASVFRNLITEGFLSKNSNSLCIATQEGFEIDALKEIGVASTIQLAEGFNQTFKNHTFDFIFSSGVGLDWISRQVQCAFEVSRILKPGGYFVVHTESASDAYGFNSLLQLVDTFTLINSHEIIDRLDSFLSWELVFKKDDKIFSHTEKGQTSNGMIDRECSVPRHKLELIENAEPLIVEEPLKPWIELKRNIKNVKYLSKMVDISFKNRYVYVDVGARSYGSSIGGWFKKQYPKQEKPFEIYAVEADSVFHNEYTLKKGVTLLPYAAWIRNETLFFEISREPRRKNKERRGRGMGRVRPVQPASNFISDSNKIKGFDFAKWLKSSVTNRDYVVVKMDIEGSEFHVIPRLIETRAACLIDEMFVECHYNRWERCCPGKRSPKHHKSYAQCLELFSSLRRVGVLVHQWW
ncbi:uncharacterized protein [Primulina huaijiensis]|uniref:uncharacterized protein n=1 Tax=Primulina huaijiensis TaxID=1492673 RepID=UPI003CC73852